VECKRDELATKKDLERVEQKLTDKLDANSEKLDRNSKKLDRNG
jgi:hypothetical protein